MEWGREGFKPKVLFFTFGGSAQRKIYKRTWFFPDWLRGIALRVVKKTHTPCIEFSESKWFYRVQYSHLFSINVRKPGWDKR